MRTPQEAIGFEELGYTLRKTNVASENRPFQKETRLPIIHLQGLCWFQGGYLLLQKDATQFMISVPTF